MSAAEEIIYRPMTLEDIDEVPLDCYGELSDIKARIRDIGSAAILAFEGKQHVGQLQFRRHSASLTSPDGIWHPHYWGDFAGISPDLPENTVGIFCYHVGQLEPGEYRDSRYFGRGIGQGLLDSFLKWAADREIEAVVAKHTPCSRAVMSFQGGQPASVYEERGFAVVDSWIDDQLRETVLEKGLAAADASLDDIARVGMCMKMLA